MLIRIRSKTDVQKLATKKFLHSVKAAVMAMDVETLKDDQIAAVYNDFVAMVDAATPEDSSSASGEESSSDSEESL